MKTLIVGDGLAGLSLAMRMKGYEQPFELIGDNKTPSSTAIATGMYNPIVFRRLNLSWMIHDLWPVMHAFYQKAEIELGVQLIEPTSLKKKIPNEDYARLWEKRSESIDYSDFVDPLKNGFGPVKQAGMVDCALFQSTFKNQLENQGLLKNEHFDVNQLTSSKIGVPQYKGIDYKAIIFCEGAYATQNPLFSWLPFKLCKGEWIIIKTQDEVCVDVLNNKTNIIPLGNNQYKLSSTYSWDDLDWKTTSNAVEQLTNDFRALFDVSFEVVQHKAALRPTVADRRPYLGEHPELNNIYIFNGLGSKGVSLAPYFSKHLIEHIFGGKVLLKEVDIQRHIKRYLNAPN
ncbi:MAG: FAD-dependent oxidoreductase [Salibacteraceae bacterium]